MTACQVNERRAVNIVRIGQGLHHEALKRESAGLCIEICPLTDTSLILLYISDFAVNNDQGISRDLSEKTYPYKHLCCHDLWKLQCNIVCHDSVVDAEHPMSRFYVNQ